MSEPLEESHFQRRPLRRRHATQSAANFLQRATPFRLARWIRHCQDDHFRDIGFRPALASEVDRAVTRNHRQPPRKTATTGIKNVRVAPELHKNFLKYVLGCSGISEHAKSHRVNDW